MSKRCLNLSALGAVVLTLLLVADAAPYQELEHREGFVPVYIREGDTPLFNINPRLAEAFNEIDTRNLLEATVDQNSEQKPDLILMSVDGGEPVLIAQSADQLMSDNESAEAIVIAPVPESETQDDSDDIPEMSADEVEPIQAAEEGEAPQAAENDSKEMEETKEALKELVDVLAEKLEEQEQQQEKEQEKEQEQEQEQEQQQMDDEQQEEAKIDEVTTDDHKPEDQATDVSSVDAFKTKEIDVKSFETEEIDVPEEQTPDAVSTDE